MKALDAGVARGVEQDLRADDVRPEEASGIDHRETVVRLGGEVDDDVDPLVLEHFTCELGVADVALHEGDPGSHVVEACAIPCVREQVVDDDPVVGVALEPVVDEVRADEAGPAGNENPHPAPEPIDSARQRGDVASGAAGA